ncbi:hypothetical protein FIV36_07460 [Pseudomonas extremaustralis]|uniref:Uncharacterized protein n=1 Tax=Pseudomonas extremaustralis TaxID=359110 RepID=A0A5C5QJJ3_9PSED|nr:hypothetical protein FIV36_07460 [Pseudomonas extremaustralis]
MLAKNPRAPHFSSMTALSLTIFASKLAPTRGAGAPGTASTGCRCVDNPAASRSPAPGPDPA